MGTEYSLRGQNIYHSYHADQSADDESTWALFNVSMQAHTGHITVLAGPSGSGKSTLLRVLAGIDRPVAGTVTIGGHEITSMRSRARRRFRARHIAYLFQDPAANLLSYLTVREHVTMAARFRSVPAEIAVLDRLEIGHLADELPATLSAGQQQRAAFAAAIVGSPSVILADEPTAELDSQSAHLSIGSLVELRRLGATMLITSHDQAVIDVADEVVRLERGVIMT